VYRAPEPVRSLIRAFAITQVLQELSGYGRTIGSGDNEREASGRDVKSKREIVRKNYARRVRNRAV
jgi:hypothetical protein